MISLLPRSGRLPLPGIAPQSVTQLDTLRQAGGC